MKIASTTALWTWLALWGANDRFASAWQNSSMVGTCPPFGPPPFIIDENPQVISNAMGVTVIYKIEVPYPEWVSFQVGDWDCANFMPTDPLHEDSSATNPPDYQGSTAPMFARLVSASDESTPDNDNDATAKLELHINPFHVNDVANIYTESSTSGDQVTGSLKICVRFSLWTGVPTSSDGTEVTTSTTKSADVSADPVTEVNFLETNIASDVTFTKVRKLMEKPLRVAATTVKDDSSLPASLLRGQQPRQLQQPQQRRLTCNEEWGIDIFTCPSSVEPNTLVSDGTMGEYGAEDTPIKAGDTLRLCIQPNALAQQDGVMIGDVRDLTFMVPTNPIASQPAIGNYQVSSDGSTTKYCEDGYQLCVIETNLDKTTFFDTPQEVLAVGTVKLQKSSITTYNALPVPIQLTFQVEPGPSDNASNSQSSAFQKKSVFFLLGSVAVLALAF